MRLYVITQKENKKSFEKKKKISYQKILLFNFLLMKPEQNLQSITLEDINSDTINKTHSSDGFDYSSIIWIGIIMLFFIYMLHDGSSSSSQSSSIGNKNKKNIKLDATEKKMTEQARTLDMVVRNLYLKKREAEAEIRKLEMSSLSNMEADNTYDNELKIDKLNMKIEEIEVMIEKKEDELDDIKSKLEQYQDENYL